MVGIYHNINFCFDTFPRKSHPFMVLSPHNACLRTRLLCFCQHITISITREKLMNLTFLCVFVIRLTGSRFPVNCFCICVFCFFLLLVAQRCENPFRLVPTRKRNAVEIDQFPVPNGVDTRKLMTPNAIVQQIKKLSLFNKNQ